MRYILSSGPACIGCLACEEYLPGFVSKFLGRQQVTEHWINKKAVVIAIDRAVKFCPTDSITLEALK